MSGRLCCQAALVLVLAAATVFAFIPRRYDPRYPDNMVHPRVRCLKEGSFHHPRNCSWYIRCVDRMHIGYYWTYYYECEPGTMFDDDLDQCIHPSLITKGPCASLTTTTTTTEPTVIPCTGVPGTCVTYDICRPKRTQKLMCAKLQCSRRTPSLECTKGYLYDMEAKTCARPPAESDLCGADSPPINITQKGELPCSYDNLRPSSDFITRLYCDTYVLCEGDSFKEKKDLCRSYYECYKDGDEWKAYLRNCREGLLYSYETGTCVSEPTEAEKCKANLI